MLARDEGESAIAMTDSMESSLRRTSPRFSISQISTLPASFEDDLDAYAAAGLDGIGIWELKLRDGRRRRAALEAFERSGLEAGLGRARDPLDPAAPAPRRPDRPAERIECSAPRSIGSRRSARRGSSA